MGIDVDVDIKGMRKMQRKIDRLRKEAPEAVGAALYERAVGVMTDSKKQTPVDTGRLRSSGFVSAPMEVGPGGGMKVVMGYGTEYAVFVHEDTDASHTTGNAKYLEKALNAKAGQMAEQIAKAAEAMMERGVGLEAIGQGNEFPQKPNPTEKKAEKERKRAADDSTDY